MSAGIVLVGAGARGRQWLDAIDRHPAWVLAGLVEPSGSTVRSLARSVPTVASVEQLPTEVLARSRAAVIASATPSHADLAVRCLEAGLDVLVEKPVALSWADGVRIVDAARRTGRTALAAHNFRWLPREIAIRRVVESGHLGRVRSASVTVVRPPLGNLRSAAGAIDVVRDLCVHHLDAFAARTGEQPLSVRARSNDSGLDLQVEWTSGIVWNLTMTGSSPVFQHQEWIGFDRGGLAVREQEVVEIRADRASRRVRAPGRWQAERGLLDALAGRSTEVLCPTVEDALPVVAALEAAALSLERGGLREPVPGREPAPVDVDLRTSMHERRVCVIGIDAVDIDLLRGAVAAGRAPNIARLLERGRSFELHGDQDRWTSSSFVSLSNGHRAVDHELFRDTVLVPGTYTMRPAEGADAQVLPYWTIAAGSGIPATVVGVYGMAFAAAEGVDQVVGWGTLDPYWNKVHRAASHPADLLGRLERAVGHRPEKWGVTMPRDAAGMRAYVASAESGLRQQTDGMLWLMAQKDWGLFVGALADAHDALHYVWHLVDPTHPDHSAWMEHDPELAHIADSLVATLDECVGRIARALGVLDDTAPGDLGGDATIGGVDLLLTSAYSFAANRGVSVCTEPMLVGGGWMVLRDEGSLRTGDLRTTVLTRGRALVQAFVPARFRPVLGRLVPRDRWLGMLTWAHADFGRSRALAMDADGSLAVRLNVRGREPGGIVDPRDYGRVVSELRDFVCSVVDADDGLPVVTEVECTSADGSVLANGLPDLVGAFRRDAPSRALRFPDGSTTPIPRDDSRSGLHRVPGVLVATGPRIAPGPAWDRTDLLSVAPSVLALLGLDPGGMPAAPAPGINGAADAPACGGAPSDPRR